MKLEQVKNTSIKTEGEKKKQTGVQLTQADWAFKNKHKISLNILIAKTIEELREQEK